MYNVKDARESIKLIDSSAIILPVFPTNNIQFQLLHDHDSKPLYEDILDLYITKSPAAVHQCLAKIYKVNTSASVQHLLIIVILHLLSQHLLVDELRRH